MDFENLPQKSHYKFKEITSLTGVKPYVLRFWESEFAHIKPMTDENGQKIYSQQDLDTIQRIKDLLFLEKLSIPKAKAMLDDEFVKASTTAIQDTKTNNEEHKESSKIISSVNVSQSSTYGVEMREAIGNMILQRTSNLEDYKSELARELEAQKNLIKQKQFDDQDLLRLVKTKKKLSSLLSRIDEIAKERGWN